MQSLANIFWIFVALCGFSLLITVHELGHLVAAKRAGVRVNEFWIGMGPKLLQKKWGETNYCICLLPIGGACVMEGEDDNQNPDPHSFNRASKFRRFTILIAGVLMNFLMGFLIVLFLLSPAERLYTTTLSEFSDDTLGASVVGLQAEDTIKTVNGYMVLQRTDILTGLEYAMSDGYVEITVAREGQKITLDRATIGEEITLEQLQNLFGMQFATTDATLLAIVRESGYTAFNYARMVWDSVKQLASGSVGIEMLLGPVGVTDVMAQTAATSLRDFGWILAFISVNLGVMNLLPIPGLDGGRLLFLAIETILRRPLDRKIEMMANTAGLLALFALIFYVTGNDIMRLIAG